MKIYDFIICFILSIFPYLIYLLDNYFQTGSILFPYYNSILNSEYFGNYNWVDSRFGISGFVKNVFWPIIVSFSGQPYGDERIVYDYIWGIGYLLTIVYILYFLIKKNNKKLLELAIFIILSNIVWIIFLQGYMRYGIVIPILDIVLFSSIFIPVLKKKDKILDSKIFFIISVCLSIGIAGIYIWNNFGVFDKLDCRLLFRDRENEKYNITINGVWGTIEDMGCYSATLLRDKNTPIINLQTEQFKDSKKSMERYNEIIKNNDIFVLVEGYNLELFKKLIKEYGFEIDEIVEKYNANNIPYMSAVNTINLVKLKIK